MSSQLPTGIMTSCPPIAPHFKDPFNICNKTTPIQSLHFRIYLRPELSKTRSPILHIVVTLMNTSKEDTATNYSVGSVNQLTLWTSIFPIGDYCRDWSTLNSCQRDKMWSTNALLSREMLVMTIQKNMHLSRWKAETIENDEGSEYLSQ
jgi:hypothetical protein